MAALRCVAMAVRMAQLAMAARVTVGLATMSLVAMDLVTMRAAVVRPFMTTPVVGVTMMARPTVAVGGDTGRGRPIAAVSAAAGGQPALQKRTLVHRLSARSGLGHVRRRRLGEGGARHEQRQGEGGDKQAVHEISRR